MSLQIFRDILQGKPPVRRSPLWHGVQQAHLKLNPACAVCGAKTSLEVHHIAPYHLRPELELVPSNLITLCESKAWNCHLIFGHLGSWKAFNPSVVQDAAD